VVNDTVVVEADDRVLRPEVLHHPLVVLTPSGRPDRGIGRNFKHERNCGEQALAVVPKVARREPASARGRKLDCLGKEFELREVVLERQREVGAEETNYIPHDLRH
jgi:hypothetical protein